MYVEQDVRDEPVGVLAAFNKRHILQSDLLQANRAEAAASSRSASIIAPIPLLDPHLAR